MAKLGDKRWSILWTAVVTGAPIIAFLWKGESFGLFVLLVMFSATLIYRMQDVIEFSFGPLSAKMREKLREADELVAQLKSLAMLSAKGLLDSSISTGRWPDRDRTWMLNIRNRVQSQLKALGFSESEISDAESYWRSLVAVDFVGIILGGSTAPVERGPQILSEWSHLRECRPPADPDSLRQFLIRNGWLDQDRDEWIKAYAAFMATSAVDPSFSPFLVISGRKLGEPRSAGK